MEHDTSIRQRILGLLYEFCDSSNASEIISKLLHHLDTTDDELKEQMVHLFVASNSLQALKIPILIDKYMGCSDEYMDSMLKLLQVAGDFVSPNLWSRISEVSSLFSDGVFRE